MEFLYSEDRDPADHVSALWVTSQTAGAQLRLVFEAVCVELLVFQSVSCLFHVTVQRANMEQKPQ